MEALISNLSSVTSLQEPGILVTLFPYVLETAFLTTSHKDFISKILKKAHFQVPEYSNMRNGNWGSV